MGCVRHQTAANLLPRAPRFVRYETRLSREELAGLNVGHERRRKGREAAFVTSARWTG